MVEIGFLIFILYIAIAAAVAYGSIIVVGDVRKHDSGFLIEGYCSKSDHQWAFAIMIGLFWPIAAPISFAILFAYKKVAAERKS